MAGCGDYTIAVTAPTTPAWVTYEGVTSKTDADGTDSIKIEPTTAVAANTYTATITVSLTTYTIASTITMTWDILVNHECTTSTLGITFGNQAVASPHYTVMQ